MQPKKAGPLVKKCGKSLQASINTPFEARGLLSGTIIRGTLKAPKSQLVTPSAQSCKGLMGAIKSRIGPFEGRDHGSPEPSLGQGQPTPEDLRLSRGPPSSNGHTIGSPEAQSSPRSNFGYIATPTDQIVGTFNAKVA
jgi:hypothetical protein